MVDYKVSGKVSHERQAKLTHYPSPLTRPPRHSGQGRDPPISRNIHGLRLEKL